MWAFLLAFKKYFFSLTPTENLMYACTLLGQANVLIQVAER